MADNILDIENLTFAYHKDKIILNNISFHLIKGESLGILGPNGGGKSTLLKILVGLLEMQTGSIKINGVEVTTNSHYPRHLFGYVPQATTLNNLLPIRVSDLLEFAGLSGHPTQSIDEALDIVGIKHKKEELVSALSGGEKQRALLAKALIHRPEILVLDEPTNGLDSTGQDQLIDILNSIKKNKQTGVIIVDHNINQILRHCDKILCLNNVSHWHDNKDLLTKNVLESIYHCEFEHILIHEKEGTHPKHHQCEVQGKHIEHDQHYHQELDKDNLEGKK